MFMQILERGKEVAYSVSTESLHSRDIDYIVKKGFPDLLRDHPSSGYLTNTRIQPAVLLGFGLNTQSGPHWFSHPTCKTDREVRIQATYQ